MFLVGDILRKRAVPIAFGRLRAMGILLEAYAGGLLRDLNGRALACEALFFRREHLP